MALSISPEKTTQAAATNYNWLQEPIGLYLHVPFCESKCIYCDFNSYAHMQDKYSPFVAALCKDLRRGVSWDIPGAPSCENTRIATVFLGGGTPSVLDPHQIGAVLAAARDRYQIGTDIEITMEANPGTITLQRFEGYRRAGINRLSMGVQVLDDAMLKKLGRIHTAEGAIESYRFARQAGFDNINLDYIYGLPGQDLAHLSSTLDRLLSLYPLPEHLSFYSLIVEEHTPLYVGVTRGLIKVPQEDEVAEMYELITERLSAVGYQQYEISNWSRGKPCAHNLIYWHDQRYLAFGPGASGYWQDTRYSTILGPADYIAKVELGESVVEEREEIQSSLEMGEFMMLGLRLTGGISKAEFLRRFGLHVDQVYEREIDEFVHLGLLQAVGDSIALTERGMLLGNEVFARFIP